MAKIISVAIQKGGCAKTTTTINVASCLAQKGYKVLTIDLDPQGNLSYGCNVQDATPTIYEVLKSQSGQKQEESEFVDIKDAVVRPKDCEFDVVPANIRLAGAESFPELSRQILLKKSLKTIRDEYDYILVDCPPSLGIITVNAFMASDYILIPMEPSYFAIQGLEQLIGIISQIQGDYNENLQILGIVITRYSKRNNLTKLALDEVVEKTTEMGLHVYNTTIMESVVVKESQAMQLPIMKHEPNSPVSKNYQEFTDELLKGVE